LTDFLTHIISLLAEALSFVIPDKKIESLCRLEMLLFEILPSTSVDKQNQFISGLTGNNPINMPKKELSLQDIAASVTECILVAWILKNIHDKKIHLKSAEALYFLIRNHK